MFLISNKDFFFFLKERYLFIYLFIYLGCVGSSFLCEGFLQLQRAGASLHRGAWASHCRGLSCCGAQAPDAQAQQLWLTGLVAPRHVGSSQTRTRTRVPCIGRRILNHCATREAPGFLKKVNFGLTHVKRWHLKIRKHHLRKEQVLPFLKQGILPSTGEKVRSSVFTLNGIFY